MTALGVAEEVVVGFVGLQDAAGVMAEKVRIAG
jgi:hypothetical protein